MIITLDPGHGGRDPGAVGLNGTFEKEVVLDIALRCKELSNHDIRLTRSTDIFIPLRQRLAVRGSAAFISLHCNAHGNRGANGTETFFSTHTRSRALAEVAQAEMIRLLGRRNRGVKVPPGNGFAVLNVNRGIPSILLEFAFISNIEEERLLRDTNFRQRAAETINNTINNFF